jgi:hypothetical protein
MVSNIDQEESYVYRRYESSDRKSDYSSCSSTSTARKIPDNKVVLVAPSFPALVVPPAETARSNNINNDDIDENDGDGNIYRTEEDDRYDDNEKDSGGCGWRDLGDEYYGSVDDDCLVF